MTERSQAGAGRVTRASTADQQGYPGKDLGFPQDGPGAIAGMGRRIGALFIDWLVCSVIVLVAIRPPQGQAGLWTLAIFAAQDFIFTGLLGVTLGKQLLRIRVVSLDGGMIAGWALLRTLLLLTVVPPLLTDRDLRGLHDRAANTAVVRM
ncbi:MAG TPA: RDD family protein [Streptosporangiaceae bacterium]